MLLPISSIHVPEERIREYVNLVDAVKERTASLMRLGQLQPILVDKLPEPIDGKEWKLVDGLVRLTSLTALNIRLDNNESEVNMAFKQRGLVPGMIEAAVKEELDPIMLLMMEFHANEDRKDFTWKEKGNYIRRIHDMLVEAHKDEKDEWTARKTAEYINQSEATVSHYLQLTDESNPLVKQERVQAAKTKTTAIKQLKIAREKDLKFQQALNQQERELRQSAKIHDYTRAADLTIYKGDCRHWIKSIPSGSLDWFHWDPPYGGKEGEGGAFAGHQPIQTDTQYCLQLMLDMLPEIWRVLRDGSWLAIWYTPVHYNWLRLALKGHRFNASGECEYCFKHILGDYVWLSENYSCRPSPFRFWVNPYPNLWLKTNRVADGHEITRFFVKETEPFLLAGKNVDRMPILLNSGRGNVFKFDSVERSVRRHVNHKPPELLKEILSSISVPGSLGGDAGLGSGSIIEAAYDGGRKVIGAEIIEEHWKDSYAIAVEKLKLKNYGPMAIAQWLEGGRNVA